MTQLIHVVSEAIGELAGDDLAASLARELGEKKPALIVCFCSMKQPLAAVLSAVQRRFEGAAVVGSSTAGEFTETGEHPGAAVAVALVGDFKAHAAMAENAREDTDGAAKAVASALPARAEGYPHRTALLLFDGLAGVGEEMTLACAEMLGLDTQVAGAAAGDDWSLQGTVVGAGGRAATNAVAIAVIDSRVPLGIGVAHGHRSTGRRVRVTRSEGSVVHELDGKPAWQRYVELTRDLGITQQNVDPDTIEDGGKRLQFFAWYQTGIDLGDSYKNRTPLSLLDGGAMAFACGIPEGTEMEVLSSDCEAQVESARAAARQAIARLGGAAVAGAIVFECACRQVYLGGRFSEAPRAVAEALGGVPIAGFEAYGEVALNVGDFSGFHNATTVVLAFPADVG
jgi:methyl-accepting chemotaxis protein